MQISSSIKKGGALTAPPFFNPNFNLLSRKSDGSDRPVTK